MRRPLMGKGLVEMSNETSDVADTRIQAHINNELAAHAHTEMSEEQKEMEQAHREIRGGRIQRDILGEIRDEYERCREALG